MARDPPRKIGGEVASNHLSKSWSNSINKGYFLCFFWVLAVSWQGDLVFSILKSTRFLIVFTLLGLISLSRRKWKISTFQSIWCRLVRQNFDLINFWNSVFLKIPEGYSGMWIQSGSVWEISLVRRDRKWSKKHDFFREFCDPIKLLLVISISKLLLFLRKCYRMP